MSRESYSVWSIIKFKVKEEHIDEFLEVKIPKLPNEHFKSGRLIRIDEREFANIIEYENMEKTLGHQDEGLEWLNSVEHLLEWYGDSRTEASSGIEIHEY